MGWNITLSFTKLRINTAMIIKRKLFSKFKDESKETAKDIAGIGLALGGAKLIKDSNKNGELSGRVKLYYSVNKKHIPDILKNGLDGKYSRENPDSLTSKVTGGKVSRDNRNIIYLARDKKLAESVGTKRLRESISNPSKDPKFSRTLEVEVPYEKLKNKRVYGNPEFENAKTFDEFLKYKNIDKNNISKEELIDLKKDWKDLGGHKGSKTIMLDGKLKPENFKGSSKFKKNSIKEIAKYIKSNPKRFAKGVGKVGLGVGSVLAAGKLVEKEENSKNTPIKDNIIGLTSGGLVANKIIKDTNNKIKDREVLNKINIDSKSKLIDRKRDKIINSIVLDPKNKNRRRELDMLKIRENAEKIVAKDRENLGKYERRSNKILNKARRVGKAKGILVGAGIYGSYMELKHRRKNHDKK